MAGSGRLGGRSLLLLLLVGFVKITIASDGEQPSVSASGEDSATFNPREAVERLSAYQEERPAFAATLAAWMTVGLGLLGLGQLLFIYSEMRAVLLVRDQDLRSRLVAEEYMTEAAKLAELTREENASMQQRPYITLIAMLVISAGLSCVLYPLCDILTVIDLPSAPCLLLVTFGAFFAAICLSAFTMFVVWSCTRPWAALVFLSVSLAGVVLLPTGNPVFLLIWIVGSTCLVFWYFYYAKEHMAGEPGGKPVWLQDVGEFRIALDVEEVAEALQARLAYETRGLTERDSLLGKAREGDGDVVAAMAV